MQSADIMKEIGRRWKSLGLKEKKYFDEKSEQDKFRFTRETALFKDEMKRVKMKADLLEQSPLIKRKFVSPNPINASVLSPLRRKMRRDPNQPKKPLSAYIYFSQEIREVIKQENPRLTVAEIMKEVSNRWQRMDREQKCSYEVLASKDKKRYEKELGLSRKAMEPDDDKMTESGSKMDAPSTAYSISPASEKGREEKEVDKR